MGRGLLPPEDQYATRASVNNITDPSTELSRLVRSWRSRLDPADFPGHAIPGFRYTRRRRKTRMTQEDVAQLIGVSSVWYGLLERGDRSQNYSDDFLDRTAYVLRLNPSERTALYLYAVGREPDTHDEVIDPLTPQLRRLLASQIHPAYLSNENWDVIAYNDAMCEWFPWVRYERNVMRWVFTYSDARRQLHRWDTDWAPLMLAQMRLANARNPDNLRLASLIDEIRSHNADAQQLWEQDPMVYTHPDGDHRQLHLPKHHGIKTVEIIAMSPMRAPALRFVTLVQVD